MSRQGYLKIHRQITEWEWYNNANTMRVFLHLLFTANFTETEFKGDKIMPGQCVVSLENLAKTLNLSKQEVRTTLSHLLSTQEITQVKKPYGSIISIENWGKYQGNQHRKHTVSNTDSNTIKRNIKKYNNSKDTPLRVSLESEKQEKAVSQYREITDAWD